jgi:hypothetical protein
VSARFDFVLFAPPPYDNIPPRRDVLIEFKRNVLTIRKDLHKLLAEDARFGRCMLHVCHAADATTVGKIVEKYNSAMRGAIQDAQKTREKNGAEERDLVNDGWLILLVLALRHRGKANAGTGAQLRTLTWHGANGWQPHP